jgi:uncharacterized protein YpuA (DUF1002 family)
MYPRVDAVISQVAERLHSNVEAAQAGERIAELEAQVGRLRDWVRIQIQLREARSDEEWVRLMQEARPIFESIIEHGDLEEPDGAQG